MGGTCCTYGSEERCISNSAPKKNPEGIFQLGDVVVDGRMLLKWISDKCVPMYAVSAWPTIMDQ